jgi:hypothetical protein
MFTGHYLLYNNNYHLFSKFMKFYESPFHAIEPDASTAKKIAAKADTAVSLRNIVITKKITPQMLHEKFEDISEDFAESIIADILAGNIHLFADGVLENLLESYLSQF